MWWNEDGMKETGRWDLSVLSCIKVTLPKDRALVRSIVSTPACCWLCSWKVTSAQRGRKWTESVIVLFWIHLSNFVNASLLMQICIQETLDASWSHITLLADTLNFQVLIELQHQEKTQMFLKSLYQSAWGTLISVVQNWTCASEKLLHFTNLSLTVSCHIFLCGLH